MVKIPGYGRDEVARRGDEIYGREVVPHLGSEDEGKFALIDVETGDYEVDRDEIAASDRLFARHPDAQVWTRQVGSRYARRLGSHKLGREYTVPDSMEVLDEPSRNH